MDMKDSIVNFPKHYKPIPHPYYVCYCDDHCHVCKLDENFNLVTEVSQIHWDRYQVRRWALEIAKENTDR